MRSVDFRLLLVTDRTQARGRPFLELLRQAVEAGLPAIQLRERDLPTRELIRLGREIGSFTKPRAVPLIVNDRVDRATLDRLDEYIGSHFAMEEGLMRQAAYPYYEQHRAQHDAMRQRSAQLIGSSRAGRMVLTQEVVDLLANWLVEHIRDHDRRMIAHLRRRH